MSKSLNLSFSEELNNSMTPLKNFHDNQLMVSLFITLTKVFNLFIMWAYLKWLGMFFSFHVTMEMFWIIFPFMILLYMGVPSITFLYMEESILKLKKDLKVIGSQWFWSYEEFKKNKEENFSFWESYMSPSSYNVADNENSDYFNKLSTSEILEISPSEEIRVSVTSNDVMHSWALPSLFKKIDAIPGRQNMIILTTPMEECKLYGQCSELCGANHSFMPIAVKIS